MPADYKQGKIYKIYNDLDENEFYIGSTAQKTLAVRMGNHRDMCKRGTCIFRHFYTRMNEVGVDHFRIVLIESYSCNNRDELRAREDHYIRTLKPPLNSNNAVRSRDDESIQWQKDHQRYYERYKDKVNQKCKKYYQEHSDKIRTYSRQYYEENKERINAKGREKVQCQACSKEMTRNALRKHIKKCPCIN